MKILRCCGWIIGCGTLLLVLGVAGMLNGSGPALAQGRPPRPTVPPLFTPTPKPDRDQDPTAVPAGRITGTVIDQTTGAPAPGISVAVGDVAVESDRNGNYDRGGLSAGQYRVELMLAPGQGVAAQGPITVTLEANQTVVEHLFFRSAAVVPTPAPAVPQMPASLPNTGEADQRGWPIALVLFGTVLVIGGMLTLATQRRQDHSTRETV